MFTSSQNQVNALRAMKTKKISNATAFGADLNKSYVKYFEDCGIGAAAMEGMNDVRVRGGIAARHRAFVG
jgi:maleate cis-trans isomerase